MSRVFIKEVNHCNDCPNHFIRGGGADDYRKHACKVVKTEDGNNTYICNVTWPESPKGLPPYLCEIPYWCPLQIIPRFEEVTP